MFSVGYVSIQPVFYRDGTELLTRAILYCAGKVGVLIPSEIRTW